MSVPVCVCVCVLVCGGVPLWVGSRSHRILPTSSLFASAQHNYLNKNTKIQKEIIKPPLPLPLYNSVILNTKAPRTSTNQKTVSPFTIIQRVYRIRHNDTCAQTKVTAAKVGTTQKYSNIVALVLCAPFTFV